MRYEKVSQQGEGIVQIGDQSYEADWHLNGLQKIIETRLLDGSVSRANGLLDYVTINVSFHEKPAINDLPSVGSQTSLMLDATRYGNMWITAYGETNGRLTADLSNRPIK